VVASEPSGEGGDDDVVAWGMLMAWVNGRAFEPGSRETAWITETAVLAHH
jgi:hypothetical protein